MTSRERMKKAIHFQGPDRVPITFKDLFPLFIIPPISWQPQEPYYPYIHPWMIKLRVWRPKRKLPKGWLNTTRECIDEWGTTWRMSPVANQGETIKGALEDGWHLMDGYKPPDFKDWSRYRLCARLSRIFGAQPIPAGRERQLALGALPLLPRV